MFSFIVEFQEITNAVAFPLLIYNLARVNNKNINSATVGFFTFLTILLLNIYFNFFTKYF